MTATLDIIGTPETATASRAHAETLERFYTDAATSFAQPTGASFPAGATARAAVGQRTASEMVADPELLADLADAPELRAVEELRSWLHLTYEDVARVSGLSGPSLLHYWRQRHRTGSPVRPRAATVEQLWRVHALVRAIAETLQGAEHTNATRLWFRNSASGAVPLELLYAGDIDGVERLARPLLFDTAPHAVPAWRRAVLEDASEPEPPAAVPTVAYEDEDFA